MVISTRGINTRKEYCSMAKDTLAKLWKDYEDYLHSGDEDQSERMRFPSDVLALNQAIGDMDGLESGIIQIIGDEATGKTTLAFNIIAASQRNGVNTITLPDGRQINAIMLDFERTYSKEYAEALGVDTSKLLIIKTPFAEQSFNIAEQLLVEGIQLVLIDSIAMVIPKSEEDKGFEDNVKIASEASVIGRFLKRANQLADDADALVIMINQWRSNMSPMARTEKKPYGARLIKHIIKLTIELTRIKREDTRMIVEAFVSKNKMGAIGKKIQYEIEHGSGIDVLQHIFSLAVDYEIVQQTGKGRYTYNDVKAHGDAKAITVYPMDEIREKVIEAMRNETTE